MTTSYSGQGASEFAIHQVHRATSRAAASELPTVMFHGATECDLVAQRFLLAHGEQTAPHHVFNDIMDRIDKATKDKLHTSLSFVQSQLRRQIASAESLQRGATEMRHTFHEILSARLGTNWCVSAEPNGLC